MKLLYCYIIDFWETKMEQNSYLRDHKGITPYITIVGIEVELNGQLSLVKYKKENEIVTIWCNWLILLMELLLT